MQCKLFNLLLTFLRRHAFHMACLLPIGFVGLIGPAYGYRVVGVQAEWDLASEFGWRDVLAEIQNTLAELGYYKGPVDGKLNQATRKAIQRYRRRNGIIDDETIWPSVLIHMQALGEAVRMQKSLRAARVRQIDEAESRLRRHSAARELISRKPSREIADPTHDSSLCLSAPTLSCLIDEVRESIRGVNRDSYRNWALQDLIGVLANAGLVEPIKDAARRLTDARLVLVTLRESVSSMAEMGRMAEAEETVALMPDGADRARALMSIAEGWVRRGDRSAARDTLKFALREIRRIEDHRISVQLEAEAAIVFASAGQQEEAAGILAALIEKLAELKAQTFSEVESKFSNDGMAHVAAAYAEIGNLTAAAKVMESIGQGSEARRSQMALLVAYSDLGNANQAIEMAMKIDAPRYRVVGLCEVARRLIKAGQIAGGERALDVAFDHLPKINGEFATDFAWSCVAEIYGLMGDQRRAEGAVSHIEGADQKARTLWRLWSDSVRANRATEAAAYQISAITATREVDTFKKTALWSDAAILAAKSGLQDQSEEYLGEAIELVSGMSTRWWRARALSRIAKAVIVLEIEGLKQ